jgi:hypothetical protein
MRVALNDLYSGQCGLVSVLRTWLKGYAVVSSLLNPAFFVFKNLCFVDHFGPFLNQKR